MSETVEQKAHRDAVAKTHETKFEDGVLSCSCGWRYQGIARSAGNLEEIACAHLDSVDSPLLTTLKGA